MCIFGPYYYLTFHFARVHIHIALPMLFIGDLAVAFEMLDRCLLLLWYPPQLFSTLSVIVTAPALKPHTTAVLFALIGASIRLSFITLNTILLSLLFNRVLWPEAAVCLPHICMHYGSV